MVRRRILETDATSIPDYVEMSPENWKQMLYEARMLPHRKEMARRKSERAARVFGFRSSIDAEPGLIVLRMLRRREACAVRGAALRAIRARETNFKGEMQR